MKPTINRFVMGNYSFQMDVDAGGEGGDELVIWVQRNGHPLRDSDGSQVRRSFPADESTAHVRNFCRKFAFEPDYRDKYLLPKDEPMPEKFIPVDPRVLVSKYEYDTGPGGYCRNVVWKEEELIIEKGDLVIFLSKPPGMSLLVEVYENRKAFEDENPLFETNIDDPKDLTTLLCNSCGDYHDTELMYDCTECGDIFCGNCYDFGKGDGCQCHAPKAAKDAE